MFLLFYGAWLFKQGPNMREGGGPLAPSKAATALAAKHLGAMEGAVLDPGGGPEVGGVHAMEKAVVLVSVAEDHLAFEK
jgi:hypothetical protein